jgi:hypothetical protein
MKHFDMYKKLYKNICGMQEDSINESQITFAAKQTLRGLWDRFSETFFYTSPRLQPSIMLMVLCIGGAVCIIGVRISSSKSQGK